MKARRILTLFFSILTLNIQAKEPAQVRRESQHVITLFMHPIDITGLRPELEELKQKLEKPTELTRTIFKQKFSPENTTNQGVHIAYSGFVKTLGPNGQMIFPRKHSKDEALFVVTRKIHPVIIRGNTVEYFVRDDEEPTDYYKTKRRFNKEGNFYYWETKKIEKPKSKKIPASAFIIFAKPNNIVIPEGKTVAMKGPNLLLPPIYPAKDLNQDLNTLKFLKINRYFAPVTLQIKRAQKRYGLMIQP